MRTLPKLPLNRLVGPERQVTYTYFSSVHPIHEADIVVLACGHLVTLWRVDKRLRAFTRPEIGDTLNCEQCPYGSGE